MIMDKPAKEAVETFMKVVTRGIGWGGEGDHCHLDDLISRSFPSL